MIYQINDMFCIEKIEWINYLISIENYKYSCKYLNCEDWYFARPNNLNHFNKVTHFMYTDMFRELEAPESENL